MEGMQIKWMLGIGLPGLGRIGIYMVGRKGLRTLGGSRTTGGWMDKDYKFV
jgi:hypothetical protein